MWSGWVGYLLASVPATFMTLAIKRGTFVLRITAEVREKEQEEAEALVAQGEAERAAVGFS